MAGDSLTQIATARALLDAGYDNGFGVTSLDTLLCEQMGRAERLDFAAFVIRTIRNSICPTPTEAMVIKALREAFDAGVGHGEDSATAYEWGSRPVHNRDQMFEDCIAAYNGASSDIQQLLSSTRSASDMLGVKHDD